LNWPFWGISVRSGWSVPGPTKIMVDIELGSQVEVGSPLGLGTPFAHCSGFVAFFPYPVRYRSPGVSHFLKGSPLAGRPGPNKPKPPPSTVLVRPGLRYGEPVKS